LCEQIIYTGKRSIEYIQIEHPSAIAGKMDVDHIDPVVPVEDSGKDKDWNKVISRLFCDEDNVQSICWLCHKSKSLSESGDRALARRENKK
jgi:hypothetical protein